MDGENSSDLVVQNPVLKRKKSQRQDPLNSSSSEDDFTDVEAMMITTTFSSSSSEEEHQAAMCLMLLAQAKYQTEFNLNKCWSEKKINGGVYECKTCNQTFQSFQALGGHRTSHKKMKIKSEESVTPMALHLSARSRTSPKARIHECLICNAVFASGQALGGHMRRHRVTIAINSPLTATEIKSNGITLSLLTENVACRSDIDFQCLDLNLPVAADGIGESQFCFGSKGPKQQELEDSGLVFSTPTLVDCHY